MCWLLGECVYCLLNVYVASGICLLLVERFGNLFVSTHRLACLCAGCLCDVFIACAMCVLLVECVYCLWNDSIEFLCALLA